MSDDRQLSKTDSAFLSQVSAALARKLKAQRGGNQGVWFGLGMSGLVGWSVAIPTLGGALLGVWLDRRHPGPHSWTLALLVAGLFIGCANAWHWVFQEDKAMQNGDDDKEEDKHV
jgi:ATP synthase protein I